MEDLYLKLNNHATPIDDSIVEKYALEKGSLSPFTRTPIVNRYGDATHEEQKDDKPESEQDTNQVNELGNPMIFTTAEMIDFTQGVDSNP